MTKKESEHRRRAITDLLDGVVHPETGEGLAAGGFVEAVSVSEGKVDVVLKFRRARDPFSASLVRQASGLLSKAFPEENVSVSTDSREAVPKTEPSKRLPGVKRVVAVASGKGGVGKSTVAAHLALALAAEGYRVGILDADIYGPSQPALFGVEDYVPVSRPADGVSESPELIVPAVVSGVKIMSIGFFISPSDALVWRGPMAVNALRQLIRQTDWGELDWLIADLPPGTGDVHLSVAHDLELDGAVIVSTPQSLSVADARRGAEMFRAEGVGVPILGIIENMAWFTPAELPDNRYFIFGNGGARLFAEKENIEFLGSVPLMLSPAENISTKEHWPAIHPGIAPLFEAIAHRLVDKLSGGC